MKRGNLTIALSLALVFVSGVAVGAFSSRLFSTTAVSAEVQPKRKTPEDYRREYLEEMRTRLGLDDSQVVKLSTILDRTRADFRDLKEKNKPVVQRIQQDQIDAVNGLLNDTQRQEYEKMRAEREARRKITGERGDGY